MAAELEAPRSRWLGRSALIVVALTVAVGIGTPLIGLRVFHPTDVLKTFAPWKSTAPYGYHPTNPQVTDTVNAIMPQTADYRNAIRNGDFPLWTTYPAGGAPNAAVPDEGPLSPFSILYIIFPLWYAPAIAKLVELIAAIGFTYLFLRRLRLEKVPSLVGGLIFSFTGFEVVWTNWPQAHVGALIPALFWAVERAIQKRTASSALVASVVGCFMIFEGFPAVALYGFIAAAVYAFARVMASSEREQRLRVLILIGGAFALGVGLSAIQLLPFRHYLNALDLTYREHWKGVHLPFRSLVTLGIPNAFGSPPQRVYYGKPNYVEIQTFVGMSALILIAVAALRGSSEKMPRASRSYFWGMSGFLTLAIFTGGPFLKILQTIPFMSTSSIGRMRSLLGFLLACLAAFGLQSLGETARPSKTRRTVSIVIAGAGVLAIGIALIPVIRFASRNGKLGFGLHQALLPGIVGAVAVAAIVLGRRLKPGGHHLAWWMIPVLVGIEAAAFAVPFWPRIHRSEFYPTTPVHAFLERTLGDERIAPQGRVLEPGTTTLYGIRSVTAHIFLQPTWAQLLKRADPAVLAHPTFPMLTGSEEVARSPILDRLAARFFVMPPDMPVFGTRVPPPSASRILELRAGESRVGTLSVAPRGIRAVDISLVEAGEVGPNATVRAEILTPGGDVVSAGERRIYPNSPSAPFEIPIEEFRAATQSPRLILPPFSQRFRVRISLQGGGSARLAGNPQGSPALGQVQGGSDDLKVVFVKDAVVYERSNALPRFRWASRADVVPRAGDRLTLLQRGVAADTVILSALGPAASGKDATLVPHDGRDKLSVDVDAQGSGYLVVADALQDGWKATLDGKTTALVPADHAGVGVFVPQGRHVVELSYHPKGLRAGAAITALSLIVLVGVLIVSRRRESVQA